MLKKLKCSFSLMLFLFVFSLNVNAATPTYTLTASPTATQSVTFTLTTTLTPVITITASRTVTSTATLVVENRVRIDRNRMNPLQQERVEVHGLSSDNKNVTIKVYTQKGYLVKTLIKNEQVGFSRPFWDGKNANNQVVASGIYVIVVRGFKTREHFRVVVIK